MRPSDLTVFGAGIFGLSIAYACLLRGAKVRVIDKRGIGAGASGGIVGALAPHVPERWNEKKAFQLESLLMAESFWAGVAERSGRDPGYGRVGRLQAITDDRALALAEQRSGEAATRWQGRAEWRVIPADRAGDWAPLSASGYLIEDTLSARLHPVRACEALAGAVRALGGEIVVGDGDAGPGLAVWATGHEGLLELSTLSQRSVGTGVKGQAVLLAGEREAAPQLFADGVHVVPHADGTIAVGSTSEREFDDAVATDAMADELLAKAVALCPVLAPLAVIAKWAGVRPRARSRAPMLGTHPFREHHYVANGGFKIGFGMAPKVAEVMADLVLEGVDHIPAGFRVEASL